MNETKEFSLEKIVEDIKAMIDFPKIISQGFEFLEKYIYELLYKIALELIQNIIYTQTDIIGFKDKIEIEIEDGSKKRIYASLDDVKEKIINTLFGAVKLPYKNYYNKTEQKSIKVNCLNYIEPDSVSPNVKKRIMEIAPFEYYEDANNRLYKLSNINLSISMFKRTVISLGKENNDWITENLIKKNSEPYSKNIVKQAENIVISNDGGRYKEIHFENKGRNAAKKPEWTEAKAGIVFEVDEEGKKIETPYYYGRFGENWQALASHLKYASNRLGIQYCQKFETLSDCGNGILPMYEKEFNKPDNKRYFDLADFFHVTEYLWELGKKIYPNTENPEKASVECSVFEKKCEEILLTKGGKKLLDFFKLESYDNKILKNDFDNNISYFKNNYKRMNYHLALKNNLPIGSGEMEASVKKIINKRFKRNNIYWLKENANNLFCLGCTLLNNELDDFWIHRISRLNYWVNIS